MASKHAKGTFKLAGWEENTIEEFDGGAKLTRAQIKQDFTGDLGGPWRLGVAHVLPAGRPRDVHGPGAGGRQDR